MMEGMLMQSDNLYATLFLLAKTTISILLLLLLYKVVNTTIFAYRTRNRYNDLPHLPRHWLWGHLVSVGEKLSPSINQHPDYAFEEVWDTLGQPPAYMIDLAPIDRAMLIVADPFIAEAFAQPSPEYKYSTPKSNTLQAMTKLVGNSSLVLIEGEEWRAQRRRFNKGFAPAHLNTLIPLVVAKTRIFLERLKTHAKAGDAFPLKDPASDLTTDVITQLAIEKDFHAQTLSEGQGAKSRFGILTALKTMSSLTEKVGQGFELAAYLYPQRRIKEWLFDRIYTRAIYNEIINKLPNGKQDISKLNGSTGALSSAKAIVHLSLAGLDPTPAVLNSTVSQVKTFLFAGQDTTSTLIQWMAYELSKANPASPLYSEHHFQIRERLCAEHDAVFGSEDPFAPLDILSKDDANVDELLGVKLPYTTAFIKETLRLHPPAGSARLIPMVPYDPDYPYNKNTNPYFVEIPAWTHSKTGEHHEASRVRIDGMRMYICHFIVQRNLNIWGPDAHVFDPSRFLDRSGKGTVDELEEALNTAGSTKQANGNIPQIERPDLPHSHHISTLPAGSFRAFERGPRTCIGSNLAYMEAKIVLAVMARGFEYTKVGLDGTKPKSGEVLYNGTGKEDLKLGETRKWEVWGINNVTTVPVDGMRMRLKLSSESKG